MKVFHLNTLKGLVSFLFAVCVMFVLLLALPSVFCTVLWNALILETFKGPGIDWYQGGILWLLLLCLLNLVLKPEISFKFTGFPPSSDDKHRP